MLPSSFIPVPGWQLSDARSRQVVQSQSSFSDPLLGLEHQSIKSVEELSALRLDSS